MSKRVLDLSLVIVACLTLSPIFIIVMLLIRSTIGAPVFFKQLRPGQDAIPFYIYKFRTMNDKKNRDGVLLPDAVRMNHFGKLLRSTSLDELPSLWNVLKGDMSMVGPRPLLMEYLPLYNAEQSRRHEVKPGITGWAQVNGRNAIGWEDKFELDLWYVERYSLWLDIKIILLTMKKVFCRDGINAAGEATMPKFTGSEK